MSAMAVGAKTSTSTGSGRTLRLLVAAGGTGGHLYPALAVARSLRERVPEADVIFVGTRRGLEGEIVPRSGFRLELVRAAPLRGGSIGRKLRGVASVFQGFADSWSLIGRVRPSVVMGLGAYVSGTVVLTAALRGVPTLLLEPNAEPGLANRWLRPFIDVAACAWEETARFYGKKGVVTGNPVRDEILSVPPLEVDEDAREMRVLVFGGSQGSLALNRLVLESLPRLVSYRERLRFRHQTGPSPAEADAVRTAYSKHRFRARVDGYIEDMGAAYEQCDLVVSRAGATTCAELAAAGRPAILVPLSLAGGHQERNAEMMERAGAARGLGPAGRDRDRDRAPERLSERLVGLLEDPEARRRMAASARALARPEAAAEVARRLMALAGEEARS